MINQIITNIKQDLSQILTPDQMEALSRTLNKHLPMLTVEKAAVESIKNDMLPLFIAAKRVEGCSEKSLRYYESTIRNMLETINKPECQISTEDLRGYLDTYQRRGTVSKVTLDNVRRILSSFFAWLEDEDYIVKSPVRRIHKVKTGKTVKETYSDEALELMRDHCDNTRDLAMIDLLTSTGIRVGELVKLNRSDLDFENRECIVFGKGNKQRKVYFDARTKIHLQRYLSERRDGNESLFVSLLKPYERLQISGVEIRLRKIGRELNFNKVHPHKFRRTLATMAIDKGMPIEQVQQLLGHQSIDTTLQYAMVNQNNVKESHAQQSEGMKTQDVWKKWLELHIPSVESIGGEHSELIDEMQGAINADKLERTVFESIQQKVLGLLSVSGNTEYMHSIANLALLNTADNAALNNSTFDVKRNDIIQMDKKGQYIPFCTKMVFLKYYTPSAENQLHFWGQADRIAYIKAINDVLSDYIEPIVLEKEETK